MIKIIKNCISRIKSNYKKNKKILFVFLAIWVIVVAVTVITYSGSLGKQSWGNDWYDEVIELNENTFIEQKMSLINENNYNDFNSICIKFATYARNNKGNITVIVEGCDSGIRYLENTFSVNEIIDNDYRVFNFDKTISSKNDSAIDILISSDSKESEGAGLYYSSSVELDGNFFIDNEESENSLSIRLLTNSESLGNFCTKIIAWTCVGFTLLIILLLLFEPKLEVIFPIIIFVFGLVFMVVIIPLSPPDEQYHYECSLQLSNKFFGHDDTHTVINKAYVNYSHFYGHYNISNGYIRFLRDINEPLDLSSHDYTITSDVDEVYSAYFIPQTVGIVIARLFGVNMLRTFYAGRLTNLIFYCICIYFVIKNTPIYKMLFGVIASMPIFIQTAASMSYDCFIIALSMLILSFFMKWKFNEEKITVLDFIIASLCCLGLANAKYVYSLLSLLFFLIPKERFDGSLKKIIMCLILCYLGMYAFLPIIIERVAKIFEHLFAYSNIGLFVENGKNNNIISADTGFGSENFEHFETAYIYYQPLMVIGIFYRTIRYSIKTWFYNSIGRTLSGNTLILPVNFARVMSCLLFVTAFREEDDRPSIITKIVFLFVSICIGLLILVGFFLTWTDVNQQIIEDYGGIIIQGVQGRYFSPLIPYFMTLFNNGKLKISKKIDKFIILALILLTFEIIAYVLSYTFVN